MKRWILLCQPYTSYCMLSVSKTRLRAAWKVPTSLIDKNNNLYSELILAAYVPVSIKDHNKCLAISKLEYSLGSIQKRRMPPFGWAACQKWKPHKQKATVRYIHRYDEPSHPYIHNITKSIPLVQLKYVLHWNPIWFQLSWHIMRFVVWV
jgi:hypothetical protein